MLAELNNHFVRTTAARMVKEPASWTAKETAARTTSQMTMTATVTTTTRMTGQKSTKSTTTDVRGKMGTWTFKVRNVKPLLR